MDSSLARGGARNRQTQLLTVAWYTAGGLVAGAAKQSLAAADGGGRGQFGIREGDG